MRPTARAARHTALIIALAGLTGTLSACGSIPTREERMKTPQTAMRGPAYKRLVVTFNEAHNLAVKATDHAAELEATGAPDEQVQTAVALADDAAEFADDIEWFLTNRRRMQWHQRYMNGLWVRYDELNPEHRDTVVAFTEKDLRKPSFKISLKNEYRDRYGIERPESRWGDLTYTVGAKLYPGNPWEGERER
jgi:hypothetical protein